MPRKDPSSTKLLKYERWTTFEPVQRMSASSTKSIRQLSRTRRSGFRHGGQSRWASGLGMAHPGPAFGPTTRPALNIDR